MIGTATEIKTFTNFTLIFYKTGSLPSQTGKTNMKNKIKLLAIEIFLVSMVLIGFSCSTTYRDRDGRVQVRGGSYGAGCYSQKHFIGY
jgi:hypothetical protein